MRLLELLCVSLISLIMILPTMDLIDRIKKDYAVMEIKGPILPIEGKVIKKELRAEEYRVTFLIQQVERELVVNKLLFQQLRIDYVVELEQSLVTGDVGIQRMNLLDIEL